MPVKKNYKQKNQKTKNKNKKIQKSHADFFLMRVHTCIYRHLTCQQIILMFKTKIYELRQKYNTSFTKNISTRLEHLIRI